MTKKPQPRFRIRLVPSILALAIFSSAALAQQAPRFVSNHYRVSFQPPAGWAPDVLVEYVGPVREDGGQPALTLTTRESIDDLSDAGVEQLVQDLVEEFSGTGAENARVVDHQPLSIGGLQALQVDLTYDVEGLPMKLRQVLIAAAAERRTYQFELIDSADHFAASEPAVQAAIDSFASGVPAAPDRENPTPNGEGSGISKGRPRSPLVSILAISILSALVGAGIVLLSRRRA